MRRRLPRPLFAPPDAPGNGAAFTEAQGWRVFSREGFGFTVELPSEPRVKEYVDREPEDDDEGEDEGALPASPPLAVKELELEADGLSIGASQTEREDAASEEALPPERWLNAARDRTAAALGVAVLSERRFEQDGFPAADLAYGTEAFFALARMIVTPTHHYSVVVTSLEPIAFNPVAFRVINSFRLAP